MGPDKTSSDKTETAGAFKFAGGGEAGDDELLEAEVASVVSCGAMVVVGGGKLTFLDPMSPLLGGGASADPPESTPSSPGGSHNLFGDSEGGEVVVDDDVGGTGNDEANDDDDDDTGNDGVIDDDDDVGCVVDGGAEGPPTLPEGGGGCEPEVGGRGPPTLSDDDDDVGGVVLVTLGTYAKLKKDSLGTVGSMGPVARGFSLEACELPPFWPRPLPRALLVPPPDDPPFPLPLPLPCTGREGSEPVDFTSFSFLSASGGSLGSTLGEIPNRESVFKKRSLRASSSSEELSFKKVRGSK